MLLGGGRPRGWHWGPGCGQGRAEPSRASSPRAAGSCCHGGAGGKGPAGAVLRGWGDACGVAP